jgi:hypothetical protein
MKNINKFLLFSALFLFLSVININAQDESDQHVVTVTTFHLKFPTDGTNKEFNDIWKDYFDKVLSKSSEVISRSVYRHFWGSDNTQLVLVSEFKNLQDLMASEKTEDDLFTKAYPNKDDQDKFNKTFRKYVGNHSDEIYHLVNKK